MCWSLATKATSLHLILISCHNNAASYKHTQVTVRTCCMGDSSGEAVSLRLFLKHQLAARLDGVVLVRFGDVTHWTRSSRQRSIPRWLCLRRVGHEQEPRQPFEEKLDVERNVFIYIKLRKFYILYITIAVWHYYSTTLQCVWKLTLQVGIYWTNKSKSNINKWILMP